ncbi:MAG: helix-turn-helix transcriptional regulator [Herminiimonas sp.]|uniref:helix-turn-helix domain-containing protein n=1 Tax=Herminiimonas sp. TaxID=1926289 RepID=UPI002726EEE9|nr:helix-turn-helix transcriptional regulator [Herminiimonas sp.]MDO9419985.1 helix-turn-helix transcriptional regulator [Herminiimonas sp.]
MSVIAKRLKEARKAEGISQERLGVLAGIDEMSASARMNQYEREKHIPDVSVVERIAKALNLPVSYFYEQDDEIASLLVSIYGMNQTRRKKIAAFIEQIKAT